MSMLYPLGLIALLGIIILIIIYLIKPNYQNKFVSSTFVWKLSLKYKKKKLPTSKLRNILLIICQVLILTLCAAIITYPIYRYQKEKEQDEVVAVLDASASMRTEYDEQTRFERAISQIKTLSKDATSKENGVVTVIVADDEPYTLFQKYGSDRTQDIDDELDSLLGDGKSEESLLCSYGSGNIDGALDICDKIVTDNPTAKVYLYTDKTFDYVPKNITVVKVTNEEEVNFGILNASADYYDNYYDIIVDLSAYGNVDKQVSLNVHIEGANAEDSTDKGSSIDFEYEVNLAFGVSTKVIFQSSDAAYSPKDATDQVIDVEMVDDNKKIQSFSSIWVYIDGVDDSYRYDNNFYIFGGQKETIKVLYVSEYNNTVSHNKFVEGVLYTLQNTFSEKFNIEIKEKKDSKLEEKGYDYYIYEHEMPNKLPTDGICVLMDPCQGTLAQTSAGFSVSAMGGNGSTLQELQAVEGTEDNQLLKDMNISNIKVSAYEKLSYYDDDYTVLAEIDNNPVILYRDGSSNNPKSKIVLVNFSVHYSNFALVEEFPFFFTNLFNYFTPSLVSANAYEYGETVTFNSRGEKVEVSASYGDKIDDITEFPATLKLDRFGQYSVIQETYYGKTLSEYIWVRIPKAESDIFTNETALKDIYYEDMTIDLYDDLVLYFAIALVALVFFEWWLKNRDNI